MAWKFCNESTLNSKYIYTFNKYTTGVIFINVFTCSFYACRSQQRKKLLELTVFFALSGSESVKAESKMLVKLTPGLFFLSLKILTLVEKLCTKPQQHNFCVAISLRVLRV